MQNQKKRDLIVIACFLAFIVCGILTVAGRIVVNSLAIPGATLELIGTLGCGVIIAVIGYIELLYPWNNIFIRVLVHIFPETIERILGRLIGIITLFIAIYVIFQGIYKYVMALREFL
jgi:small neutral amino acid transporter SnatA (MarC family)